MNIYVHDPHKNLEFTKVNGVWQLSRSRATTPEGKKNALRFVAGAALLLFFSPLLFFALKKVLGV